MSVREIESTWHVSHHTVREVCDKARAKGLTWDTARLMGQDEVADLLFPEKAAAERATGADFDDIYRQLAGLGLRMGQYATYCTADGKQNNGDSSRRRGQER